MVHIFGKESEIETLKEEMTDWDDKHEMQVSYNNWGQLSLRFFAKNDEDEVDDEFLVVLSEEETSNLITSNLIKFVANHLKNV